MNVRLFQAVGNDEPRHHVTAVIDWPDGLQLPSHGDRILVSQEMLEVDHIEYLLGEDPTLMFELTEITNLRGDEAPADWAATFRKDWELR